jgi:hypothetical protein
MIERLFIFVRLQNLEVPVWVLSGHLKKGESLFRSCGSKLYIGLISFVPLVLGLILEIV